ASIYSLRLVQRAFFGPAQSSEPIEAATGRETVMLLGLVVLTLWIGFYPQPLLNTSAAAIGQVQQIYAAAIQAAEAAAP
ncbi:MAG TPA: NADH-quinone oxidoreductase subunit M, partial [Pseudomonadales bacterium]|nr:NADH-quinone oxidoreductase subunit M [Pseudomonadales bacterium]